MAAGGTGGHMFPGSIVAEELVKRGHRVALITDHRGASFDQLFKGLDKKIIRAGNLSGSLVARFKSLFSIVVGWWQARSFLTKQKADVVVGFGGYPAFPAMLAARISGRPFCLHEQNAVMGRVNKAMAPKAKAIATSFEGTQNIPADAVSKVHLIGNPVRAAFREIENQDQKNKETFSILVVGGSQGARILSDIVPEAVAALNKQDQQILNITQQCRPEDAVRVEARYKALNIDAQCPAFIDDMPMAFAAADIIIARAGALTVSEVAAAGKAAIFVPLAIAVDNHQYYNAEALKKIGGAIIVEEKDFNKDALASEMSALMKDRKIIQQMAKASKQADKSKAIENLADIILDVAQQHNHTSKNNKRVAV